MEVVTEEAVGVGTRTGETSYGATVVKRSGNE
jgi:hypothetical protein